MPRGTTPAPPTNFYPRPPRGGRPVHHGQRSGCQKISIHALREEGDGLTDIKTPAKIISIHALREEGDSISMLFAKAFLRFLSTPSARRATCGLGSADVK